MDVLAQSVYSSHPYKNTRPMQIESLPNPVMGCCPYSETGENWLPPQFVLETKQGARYGSTWITNKTPMRSKGKRPVSGR